MKYQRIKDLLKALDGRGLIITDDDLIDETLNEYGKSIQKLEEIIENIESEDELSDKIKEE